MWKFLKTTITSLTIVISTYQLGYAQQLKSLGYSHAITQAAEKLNKSAWAISTDSIHYDGEFFEDFSTYHYEHYPRPNRWADYYAFINSTYADSMISLGVATLDAYDSRGYPHYTLKNKNVPGDSLTSRPFAFNVIEPDKPMYFSFFFQAGGKGDKPEGISTESRSDSLVLEFYSIPDSTWITAFYTLNDTINHTFKQEIIEVPDSLLQDGFRFRFRNFVSAEKFQLGTDPGRYGNADMWHVDYIQMRQTNDPTELAKLNDLTIPEPLKPFLKEYIRVPWHHYSMAQPIIEVNHTDLAIKSNFPDESSNFEVERHFNSFDTNGDLLNSHNSSNFMSGTEYAYWQEIFSNGLSYDQTEYGGVELVTHVHCDLDQRPENDTAKRRELYYDHYAYDDGSAESAYAIGGESQDISRIALRFRAFRRSNNPDSLYAVLIYFAKSADSVTLDYEYKLSIRKNNGKLPSNEILYESTETLTPDYSVGINEFTRIELDPPIVISDTFFVVIDQLNGNVHIGYDHNNNNVNKQYLYVNSSWDTFESINIGTLMIRASFKPNTIFSGVDDKQVDESIEVYPNPASDRLFFTSSNAKPKRIQVFNMMGVMVMNVYTEENSVAISHLTPGIYFIRFSNEQRTLNKTVKFIKQ